MKRTKVLIGCASIFLIVALFSFKEYLTCNVVNSFNTNGNVIVDNKLIEFDSIFDFDDKIINNSKTIPSQNRGSLSIRSWHVASDAKHSQEFYDSIDSILLIKDNQENDGYWTNTLIDAYAKSDREERDRLRRCENLQTGDCKFISRYVFERIDSEHAIISYVAFYPVDDNELSEMCAAFASCFMHLKLGKTISYPENAPDLVADEFEQDAPYDFELYHDVNAIKEAINNFEEILNKLKSSPPEEQEFLRLDIEGAQTQLDSLKERLELLGQ